MTILYSESIMSAQWWFTPLLVITIIFLMITLISILRDIHNDIIKILTIILATIMLVFIIIGYFNKNFYMYDTGRKRYTVLFDGGYPIEEAYSKYIIKEHKGLMWIIEDKESAE